MIMKANIVPLDRAGRYRISAEGFSLESNYPINRLCKALFDHGYLGRLEVYGLSADGGRVVLRYSCDIEKMAAKRLSETDAGFKHLGWDAKSLGALNRVQKGNGAPQESLEDDFRPGTPASNERRSLGKGIGGSDRPVTQDTGSHLAEVEVVL